MIGFVREHRVGSPATDGPSFLLFRRGGLIQTLGLAWAILDYCTAAMRGEDIPDEEGLH